MQSPLAYFLTWRTYGTWLLGDERGSVETTLSSGRPRWIVSDPARRIRARNAMIQKPVILGREQRDMVESAISDLCNARGWSLLAVNVRSNHVHAAVRADGVTPEQVLRDMKAQASRRLSDHAGLPPVSDRNGRRKWWAEHGSTIWINDTDRLQEGVRYVSEGQGED